MFTKSANVLVKLESVQRNARSDSRLSVGAYQRTRNFSTAAMSSVAPSPGTVGTV
jgi:hypothetical protein